MKTNTLSDQANVIDKKLTVDEFLAKRVSAKKLNVKSLISTFFGDLAAPFGGEAWVENISHALAPLGVNNRLVRTSLFRLVEEQWLVSTRSGRKSYYQLTDKAISQTQLAEKLIYHTDQQRWDGKWTMVFIVMNPMDTNARKQLEQELTWIGFGAVAKHVLAHPTAPQRVVAQRVKSLGMQQSVVCMRAENLCDAGIGLAVDDQQLAAACFPTDALEASYDKFIETFSALNVNAISLSPDNGPLLALRLVLLDEYRRIILHDPHLPSQLLPDDWKGDQAYQLCKTIYRSLLPRTDEFYRRSFGLEGDSLLTPLDTAYGSRFE